MKTSDANYGKKTGESIPSFKRDAPSARPSTQTFRRCEEFQKMLEVPFEGGCQCGAIRYSCGAQPFVSYTCHCRDCQRLTSSAFATCIQVPEEAFSILQGAPSSQVRATDSGNRLTTSFCAVCSSALYSANSARPRLRTIYVGTLDCAAEVEVSAHIWTKRRLPWVVLPEGHHVFSEAGDWRDDYAADPSRLAR